MKALIVFESMYGNTRAVAEAVGTGLRTAYETEIETAARVTQEQVAAADLLVVGAPTHIRGLPRPSTRRSAAEAVAKSKVDLPLEPGAEDPGVREWLATLDDGAGARAAVFDTRLSGPQWFTGWAGSHITKSLRRLGFVLAAAPVSFLVDKQNRLLDGELARAEAWGGRLAGRAAEAPSAKAG